MKSSDRKRQLIAEGRVYRAEALMSRETVRVAMQPDALVRNVIGQAATTSLTLLRSKEGFNEIFRIGLPIAPGQLTSLLPLALRIWSMLPKNKSALRPIVLGSAGAVVAAGAASWLFRRVKRHPVENSSTAGDSSAQP